jgi:hypothetical protein
MKKNPELINIQSTYTKETVLGVGHGTCPGCLAVYFQSTTSFLHLIFRKNVLQLPFELLLLLLLLLLYNNFFKKKKKEKEKKEEEVLCYSAWCRSHMVYSVLFYEKEKKIKFSFVMKFN